MLALHNLHQFLRIEFIKITHCRFSIASNIVFNLLSLNKVADQGLLFASDMSINLMQMCYCPKHAQMAEKKRAKSADPALLTHQTQSNPGRQLNNERQEGTETQNVLEADSFSARLHPFNHAIRRGMRAPEAVENALAKRKFLQRTPYLVSLFLNLLFQLYNIPFSCLMVISAEKFIDECMELSEA